MGIILLPLLIAMIGCGVFGIVTLSRAVKAQKLERNSFIRVAAAALLGLAVLLIGPFVVNAKGEVNGLSMIAFHILASVVLAVIGAIGLSISRKKHSTILLSLSIAFYLTIGLLPIGWFALGEWLGNVFGIRWIY